MENVIKVVQQQAFDTEARWQIADPVLYAGQIAVSTDKNNNFKIGDGTSKWSELKYYIDNFIFNGTSEEAQLALEAGLLPEGIIVNIYDDFVDDSDDSVYEWINHNCFGSGGSGPIYDPDYTSKDFIDDFPWPADDEGGTP